TEANEMFTTDGGTIKTEETQKALDALADNIEPTAEGETDDEVPEVLDDPGLGLVGKADSEDKANKLVDYDELAANPMFDVPVDDEEEISVDDEDVITEPMKLP
uniref:hypothetical protein n=1 Tax=Fibrobacter sp. TaxID=35828 RepID=UPI00386D6690